MKRKAKIKFISSNTDVPIVRFYMADSCHPHYAIIDTGSEMTVFDPAVVANNKDMFDLKETNDKISLTSVTSYDERKIIQVTGTLDFATEKWYPQLIKVKGIMAPLDFLSDIISDRLQLNTKVSLLIGSDMLKTWNAEINYKDKILRVIK